MSYMTQQSACQYLRNGIQPSPHLLQHPADPLSGSVFVVLGVPGEQLQDSLPTVWQPGKHICEGATAVDGEVKFPHSLSHSRERKRGAAP